MPWLFCDKKFKARLASVVDQHVLRSHEHIACAHILIKLNVPNVTQRNCHIYIRTQN